MSLKRLVRSALGFVVWPKLASLLDCFNEETPVVLRTCHVPILSPRDVGKYLQERVASPSLPFLLQKAFNKFISSERVPVVLATGEKDRQRETRIRHEVIHQWY